MRAFASFILLLALLPLLVLISSPYAPEPDVSGAISIERAYYGSAGLKDAIFSSILLGAKDAKAEYFARLAAGDNEVELAPLVRQKAHERLSALAHAMPPNAAIWCGPVDEEPLHLLASRISASHSPEIPQSAHPIDSEECASYIQVDPVAMSAWLEGSYAGFGAESGGIGISLYEAGVPHVSFIPAGRRVDFS